MVGFIVMNNFSSSFLHLCEAVLLKNVHQMEMCVKKTDTEERIIAAVWVHIDKNNISSLFFSMLFVCWLVFWAQSTNKGYIRAEQELQSTFHLLYAQVS